jgi:hypothetical protein
MYAIATAKAMTTVATLRKRTRDLDLQLLETRAYRASRSAARLGSDGSVRAALLYSGRRDVCKLDVTGQLRQYQG